MHFSEGLRSIKKFIEEKGSLGDLWNDVLAVLHIIATIIDPLFCYILIVDDERNCIRLDYKLRTTFVILRSLVDFVNLYVYKFHIGYSYESEDEGSSTHARKRGYYFIAIDVLAVLPVPQVMVLFVIPGLKGSGFKKAIGALKFLFTIQSFPRTLRIYSFLKKVGFSAAILSLPSVAEIKAVFNLFLFQLASHLYGAFWYLFAIERKASCWLQNCQSNLSCPLNCNSINGGGRLMMDASPCSSKPTNIDQVAAFDFGIFADAFNSGVVYSSKFIWKITYCYWWGLQNLSSLGQGFKTSNHIWEIYFAIAISINGMILFAILIGNFQACVQARISRLEEIRHKRMEKIEDMIGDQSLPHDLKEQIKQYGEHKWQDLKADIDVKNLLHCLPKRLRRDTIRHLCLNSLKKVPMLQNMNEIFLDAICNHLKPEVYNEKRIIVHRGEYLDKMIFIFQGELWIQSNSSFSKCLTRGDYYGDDLLSWVKQNPSLSTYPISNEIVLAHTKMFLQATIARLEEMRLKGQDIELWMSYHSLPRDLKKRIKRYEKYKWRETRGVDVENILDNLPRDLRRDTIQHLCLAAIARVPMLQNMDEKFLDAVCGFLKPVLYIEHNFIVREGEPLDEMIFIIRGRLWIYPNRNSEASGSSSSEGLAKGDYYGEDLLRWVLQDPFLSTVPISIKTVRTHTKVEAFVLRANDLRSVVSKFWWLFSRELRNDPRLKERWAPWAALVLQAAWRRYFRSKREKERSQLAAEGKNSARLVTTTTTTTTTATTTVIASRFIARALRALKRSRKSNDLLESSRV